MAELVGRGMANFGFRCGDRHLMLDIFHRKDRDTVPFFMPFDDDIVGALREGDTALSLVFCLVSNDDTQLVKGHIRP